MRLTRLMWHLSWPACMRLQDKWSMHAPNKHGQVEERLILLNLCSVSSLHREGRRFLPAVGCCDALACLLARGCGRVEQWQGGAVVAVVACLLECLQWQAGSCRQAGQERRA